MVNTSIKFGTDGIRGKADAFPFLTQTLTILGKAICAWAQPKKILIVGDTRESYERIKNDLCAGLLTQNILIIDGGVFSTPGACSIMQIDTSYDLGIVISASHNPYYDNGIKMFVSGGNKLTPQDEASIANYFTIYQSTQNQEQEIIGSIKQYNLFDHYKERLLGYFDANFLQGIKIVIDCANGATSAIAPDIFTQLGAEVITLSASPNGTNINDNCGALHTQHLQQEVIKHNAYAGFAFDGDGDRIMAVTQQGELRDGDDIVWMLASSPLYKHLTTIVGTVMANSGFEKALSQKQKQLVRVNVGDKNILKKLDEEKLLLGGEPSGHIILRDYLPICDGIFVALRLLNVLRSSDNHEMKSFPHFPQVLINIPVMEKKDLSAGPCATIIAHYQAALQEGRILVRYSGTENLLRIMTEASDQDYAQKIALQLGNELKLQLG